MQRDMRLFLASLAATIGATALAVAYPNMTRVITVPVAVVAFLFTIYFLWPEIRDFHSERARKMIAVIGMVICGVGLIIFAAVYLWPSGPTPIQFEGQITGIAAFDVNGQPGLANVIPVVDVRNLRPSGSAYITGYVLKLQCSDGTESESTAQSVFDPVSFNGPSGSVEINPSNTLWGKNGSPPITSFLSGRLWFPFTGVKDISCFANPVTKLTLVVSDSKGNFYSSSIRISDIIGPRIINLTNPPASLPATQAPQ